jgi:hypothetical protein
MRLSPNNAWHYQYQMERKKYIPDIVAPRYALRIEDLGRDHFVHVRCDGCQRIVLVPALELARRQPGYERMINVAKLMTCLRCPPGTPASWSIYRAVGSEKP